MAEGLAVASSIIAVIQISDRVISLCSQFIGMVRGVDREIVQMITIITALKGLHEFLHNFVKDDANGPRLPLLQTLCNSQGPLEHPRRP